MYLQKGSNLGGSDLKLILNLALGSFSAIRPPVRYRNFGVTLGSIANNGVVIVTQWIRLHLPSCSPEFESLGHHLSFSPLKSNLVVY